MVHSSSNPYRALASAYNYITEKISEVYEIAFKDKSENKRHSSIVREEIDSSSYEQVLADLRIEEVEIYNFSPHIDYLDSTSKESLILPVSS